MCVNRLISDLYKKVDGHSYIKKSVIYKPCLIIELNTSLHVVLSFKSKYYPTSYTAGTLLSILKSTLA